MADRKTENVQANDKRSDRAMAFAAVGMAVVAVADLMDGKSGTAPILFFLFAYLGAVSILVFAFVYLIARLARHFWNCRNEPSRT
jgi:hypothetical protein